MGLPKPKAINKNKLEKQNRLRDDVILESLLNNEYILIVGSEAILKQDLRGTDGTGDSKVFLYNAMLQERDIQGHSEYWPEEKWQEFFSQQHIHSDFLNTVEEIIRDGDEEGSYYKMEDISPELCSLIGTKHFRLVITTSIDGYLELLMRDVWGTELQVVNFEDGKSLTQFYTNLDNFKKGDLFIMPPTLFYAFGKVNYTHDGVSKCKYVFTENDAIVEISKWLQINFCNQELFELITHKKIMAIGCKFNDWQFRFFWYSLRHDIEKLGEGNTVAVTFKDEDGPSYSNLKHYLQKENIYVEPDSRAFMKHLFQLLNPEPSSCSAAVYEKVLANRRSKGGFIFLSYPHEDFSMVYQIFLHLVNSGYNVWFDNKNLYSGDKYYEKIKKALQNCLIFMPILTAQVANDLSAANLSRFYLRKEWSVAKDRYAIKTVKVIPLATNDYDLDQDYHTKGFRNYWNLNEDEEKDITVEYIQNIEHFKETLDKTLKKK